MAPSNEAPKAKTDVNEHPLVIALIRIRNVSDDEQVVAIAEQALAEIALQPQSNYTPVQRSHISNSFNSALIRLSRHVRVHVAPLLTSDVSDKDKATLTNVINAVISRFESRNF